MKYLFILLFLLLPISARADTVFTGIGNFQTQQILSWAVNQTWISATITRNTNEVVTSATATYPDGQSTPNNHGSEII